MYKDYTQQHNTNLHFENFSGLSQVLFSHPMTRYYVMKSLTKILRSLSTETMGAGKLLCQ